MLFWISLMDKWSFCDEIEFLHVWTCQFGFLHSLVVGSVGTVGRLNTSSYREYGTCVMELERSRPLRVIGNFTLKLRIFFLFAHFYEGRVQGKWRTFCWDINCLIPHKWLLFYQYFTYEQNFDENIAAAIAIANYWTLLLTWNKQFIIQKLFLVCQI